MKKTIQTFSRLRGAIFSALLLGLPLGAQAQSSITNGLVAYWHFDQNNFEDFVGTYDGTGMGAAAITFGAGKTPGFGRAMLLDGVDQFVEIPSGDADDLAFAGGSMSVAGWFKVGVFDKDWQALIAKGEGSNWRIHRRGAETGFAHAGGTGEGPAGGAVNDGAWHHFVAISDLDAVNFGTALYIDGEQYTMNAAVPALASNTRPVMIGENPDARNRYWNGEVDDIALWNRVLTEAEIDSLYAGGLGKPLKEFFVAPSDTDGDGMPNDWELQYGFNPNNPADAALDANGNGFTNLQEFQKGLDPLITTRPTITAARPSSTFNSVTVTFSKTLDPATATNLANYAITPALTITNATLRGNIVTLGTSAQAPGGTNYTLTVNNVRDINNFLIAANSRTNFFSYLLTTNGVMKFTYWGNLDATGTAVDILTNDPDYPSNPDLVTSLFSFNSRDAFPDDSHEQYGATIEGYITPTEAGSYRFFIYSDDASQLHLSTDATEANLVQIAEETGCCNFFTEPDGVHTRTSEPIALVAGNRYFVRMIYKEGGGGDYGQVAWRREGNTTPAGSLTPIPGRFLSAALPLPYPAEGVYTTRTPGPNARNVSPAAKITIVHSDGKTAWATNNVTLSIDGTVVPATITKVGNEVTVSYSRASLFPGGTTHTVTLGYPSPAGTATTERWTFETAAFGASLKDSVHSYNGLLMGSAAQTPDRGGQSGAVGDRGMDFGSRGGAAFSVPDASWLNTATAANELAVSIWVRRYDINASSAFWLVSPGSNNGQRGFQAHVPWSDSNIYFDTAGCCGADTQRINALIDTFPGFTGDIASGDISWWTNDWHHFVFQKAGDTKSIYIDGALFLEGSNTAPLPADFTSLFLGADNTGVANVMHGLVDDFAVFGKALAAADVTRLANGTSPSALGAATQLMAFWDFNAVISQDSVTNGLVAYWNFDTNLNDSIKDFHGTARGTNPIPFVDGKPGFGKAIKLNGNDQFVEITGGNENELEFVNGSMSVGGWFKVGAFDTEWQALIAKGEGSNYRVARRALTGTIAYAGGAGEGADNVPAVDDGEWHHFVAVTDAATNAFGTALYVDGVLLSVQTNKPALASNAMRLFIGENPEARNREWEGEIDDIAIWNRAITADEVARLYANGTGKAISTFPAIGGPPVSGITATISKSGSNITIQWLPAGAGTLESSPTVGAGATWTTVGTANPATIAIGAGNLFYRIRQ